MTSSSSIECVASKELLAENQLCELTFWKERWPYRDWPIADLQKLRHADAAWLLSNLGFKQKDDDSFNAFSGSVLEVGCGPLGVFEVMRGVNVTAIDSLMRVYAAEIPYATLGARGATTYVAKALADVTDQYRFVVCSNVLIHTSDWLEFLEHLVARVESGGELLLVTDTRSRPSVAGTQIFSPSQLERALGWLGMKRLIEFRVEKMPNPISDFRVLARVAR